MTFDLVAYAREHRLRLRNLHDGGPVPPVKRTERTRTVAYRGAEDRGDAILCKFGYVDFGGFGADRIGFCLLCSSARSMSKRLQMLAETGATVVQEGDSEVAGYAPLAEIESVLAVLVPGRVRESPLGAGFPARHSTQASDGVVGVEAP